MISSRYSRDAYLRIHLSLDSPQSDWDFAVDIFEDRAVRLVKTEKGIDAYIKRKGKDEIRSLYSCDSVQETIHELHNREMTPEEYYNY